MAAPNLNLKLLVDKRKNRVVFAESQRDFVDVLFGFLSLPLGAIVRMSNKKSQLGCMDGLYESVEKLDPRFMETKACKGMLLRPRSAAETVCAGLKLDANDPAGYTRFHMYLCPSWECCTRTFQRYSLAADAKCPCGLTMDKLSVVSKRRPKEDGVFVKGEGSFTISDDLRVTPTSTDATLAILRKCELMDCTALQEMTVEVGKEEIINLLRRSISSDTPLTDVFLRKLDVNKEYSNKLEKDHVPLTVECEASSTGTKNLKMKLLLSKSSDTLLYAEAGGDVVDFLFSLLTFPVGSVIGMLDEYCCMGCLDNLYMSLEELADIDRLVHFVQSVGMLLSPKLPPMYGCTSQLLNIKEKANQGHELSGCEDCFKDGGTKVSTPCKHGIKNVTLRAVNPKLPTSGTWGGGGFTKAKEVFMITDDLNVTPLSSISSIHAVGRFGIPISDLVVKEVSVGKHEALNLLKASLISKRALSNVFCQRKRARSLDKILTQTPSFSFIENTVNGRICHLAKPA